VQPAPNPIARFYDGVALAYDAANGGRPERVEDAALRPLLRRAIGKRDVVDLGCGTGLLLRLLPDLEQSGLYRGVDVSAGMLAVARARYPRLLFRQEDMLRWLRRPEQARSLEAAVSLWCAVNYLPPGHLLDALRRALQPGGRLFLMALTPGNLPRLHEPDLSAALYEWEPEHVLDLLAGNGFARIRARPFAWNRLPLPDSLAAAAQTLGARFLPPGSGRHRYVIYTAEKP
jgi:SAM-dependent methyltransferase